MKQLALLRQTISFVCSRAAEISTGRANASSTRFNNSTTANQELDRILVYIGRVIPYYEQLANSESRKPESLRLVHDKLVQMSKLLGHFTFCSKSIVIGPYVDRQTIGKWQALLAFLGGQQVEAS